MTLQNFEELIKGRILDKLPGLPWRIKFPLIATLDVDSFYTPEHPENKDNPLPGTSAAYGKGYANCLSDADLTRIPLTEDFMKLYFNEEGMRGLEKLMRDKGWAQPFANPLFNLWGGTCRNFSNWKVNRGDDGKLYLHTIPMTVAFYQKLSPWFSGQQLEMMQEFGLEEIIFDAKGNSLWVRNGVMTGTPVEGRPEHMVYSGTKEIVEGTGRFKGAIGSFHFNGYGENRVPEREGEPTSIGRMGIWGTIEHWWPYPFELSLENRTEEEIREYVQPLDPSQDNIILQVINEKIVAEEAAASAS